MGGITLSNKPPKKTDADKMWISKRKDRNIKAQLEYHLIICEGIKTEPNYFNGMKIQLKPQNSEKIKITTKGKGRGTTSLLDEAIREVRNSPNYISHVWLVYDKDDFSDEKFNEVVNICREKNKEEETIYHPIWSNECIETWILLHFIRFDTPITRKECIKKINSQFKIHNLGQYNKNDIDIFKKLEPFRKEAIENAKWLAKKWKNEFPSNSNPSTTIHEIVEYFEKYM